MEGHIVRPRQNGKVGDSADNRSTWYRLYVAKFPTPLAAHEFCTAMKADYQRCRVTSSTSDETVPPPCAATRQNHIINAAGQGRAGADRRRKARHNTGATSQGNASTCRQAPR